jgi:predicted ATP-binding protein involved in virulence
MLITTLHLRDFRCFEDLEIDFHEYLTVLVAPNSQGKTALLEAIGIALGTFVGAFDLGKSKHIQRTDARYGNRTGLQAEQKYPVSIAADLQLSDGRLISISRKLSGPKNKTTIKEAADLTKYGQELQEQIRKETLVTLPIVAYYSTARLWKAHNLLSNRKLLTTSRSLGYEDCLSSASSFSQVQAWIKKATLAQLQTPQNTLGRALETIQGAVNQALHSEGWRNFHYNLGYEDLVMQREEQEILPVNLLSDGTRTMISLIADLAFRCVCLNGLSGLDSPLNSPGIVIIDEIDLHLHPRWQQRVLHSLRQTFPKIQFIVTTHSPQVLSTVDRTSIRLLPQAIDDDLLTTHTETPRWQTQGVSSADILALVMGVDPVPDEEVSRQLSKYKALIQQNQQGAELTQRLRQGLEQHFGPEHPAIVDCDRLIRFQAFKHKVSQSSQSHA